MCRIFSLIFVNLRKHTYKQYENIEKNKHNVASLKNHMCILRNTVRRKLKYTIEMMCIKIRSC